MIRKPGAAVSRTRVRAPRRLRRRRVAGALFLLQNTYTLQMESPAGRSRAGVPPEVTVSPAERKRLAAQCHEAAHEVFAAINRNVGSELLSLDMPMGQFKAMATITMFGPQPVGEMGRRLGVSEPAASLLVDKLEERGLAERTRDEHDRRRTLVTATPAGQDLATRLRQGREEQVELWLAALTDDELAGLLLGFRGLQRVVREPQTEEAPRV
jgi:DNA-binding MarR family transcriptional regulator